MRHIILAATAALALAACNQGSGVERAMQAEQTAQAASDAECARTPDDRPAVQTTASGVRVELTERTTGPCLPSPTAQSIVLVNYEGALMDGTIFDSSFARGQPAPFPLSNVIPGWTEGLQLMRPGDKATITIPAALGYGAAGSPPNIPPNADLRFRVELLGVANGQDEVYMAPGYSGPGGQ